LPRQLLDYMKIGKRGHPPALGTVRRANSSGWRSRAARPPTLPLVLAPPTKPTGQPSIPVTASYVFEALEALVRPVRACRR